MKVELSSELKKNVTELISDVLNCKLDIVEFDCLYPSIVINHLKELGVKIDLADCMETNGWQMDYWIRFKYNDKRFIISGSGYYGNLEFKENNDSDDDEYYKEKSTIIEYSQEELELFKSTDALIERVNKILDK
jgi:hypothetical protein